MRAFLLRHPLVASLVLAAVVALIGAVGVLPRLDALEIRRVEPAGDGPARARLWIGYRLRSSAGGEVVVRAEAAGPGGAGHESRAEVVAGTAEIELEVALPSGPAVRLTAELRPSGGGGLLDRLLAGRRRDQRYVPTAR